MSHYSFVIPSVNKLITRRVLKGRLMLDEIPMTQHCSRETVGQPTGRTLYIWKFLYDTSTRYRLIQVNAININWIAILQSSKVIDKSDKTNKHLNSIYRCVVFRFAFNHLTPACCPPKHLPEKIFPGKSSMADGGGSHSVMGRIWSPSTWYTAR